MPRKPRQVLGGYPRAMPDVLVPDCRGGGGDMVLDLASYRHWHWHGDPSDPSDARLIERKDCRVNGRVFVAQYVRQKTC